MRARRSPMLGRRGRRLVERWRRWQAERRATRDGQVEAAAHWREQDRR